MTPPLTLSAVILRVADVDKAAAYYTNTLGFTLERRFDTFAFLSSGATGPGGGVSIILNQPGKTLPPGEPMSLAGTTEVVLQTTDIHATFDALKAKGVAFLVPAPFLASSEATHDLYAAPFRDPDGHLLSITGRVVKK